MESRMNKIEYYQESSGGRFTHNDKKYNLNKLLQLVHDYKVESLAISELKWVIQYSQEVINSKVFCYSCRKGPSGWHEERITNCDLTIPIIVTETDGRLTILDGIHRLEKAIRLNLVNIPAKVIDETLLEKCIDDNGQ